MKERIKSIAILLLCILAIYLSFLNLSLSASSSVVENDVQPSEDFFNYITPLSCSCAHGGVSYYKIYQKDLIDQLWEPIIETVQSFTLQSEDAMKEITMKEYFEHFSADSLLFDLPEGLMVRDFLELLGIDGIASDVLLSEMLVLEDVGTIYLKDHQSGRYYKISFNQRETLDLESSVRRVRASQTPLVSYRRIYDRFSLSTTVPDVYNYQLIPYSYRTLLPEYAVEQSFDLDSDAFLNYAKIISGRIFGTRADFIKKYRDVNDSVVFMYSYYTTSLTFTKNGRVMYKRKMPTIEERLPFRSSFGLALGFIEQTNLLDTAVILKKFERIGDDDVFYFMPYDSTYSLFVPPWHDPILKIVVSGGTVTEMFMNHPHVTVNEEKLISAPVDTCLVLNEEIIYDHYFKKNNILKMAQDDDYYYFLVRSQIREIEMVLYPVDEVTWKPSWKINIQGTNYIFDAQDSTLYYVYEEEGERGLAED